jgi:hypothetical protein
VNVRRVATSELSSFENMDVTLSVSHAAAARAAISTARQAENATAAAAAAAAAATATVATAVAAAAAGGVAGVASSTELAIGIVVGDDTLYFAYAEMMFVRSAPQLLLFYTLYCIAYHMHTLTHSHNHAPNFDMFRCLN